MSSSSEEDKDGVELLSPLMACMLPNVQIQTVPSALLLHAVPEDLSQLQSPAGKRRPGLLRGAAGWAGPGGPFPCFEVAQ